MAVAPPLLPFRLSATSTTPLIHLDGTTGRLLLHGRAMPIDAGSFFQPILDWLNRYVQEPAPATVLEVKLDYFNSGSSLQMARLITLLGDIPQMEVHWHYHPDDEDIEEAGRELARMARVPFVFVAGE